MDPVIPDQQAPAAPETPTTPAGNLSAVEFALRRASRRSQPGTAATGTTPSQPVAPESELASGSDVESPETEVPPQATDQSDRPADPTATDAPAAPASATTSSVTQLINDAIKEAALAPDRAAAVSKLVKRIATLVDDRDAERNRRLALEQAGKAKTEEPATPVRRDIPEGDPRLTKIEGQIQQFKTALKTIAQNPDGYTFVDEATKEERTLSAEDLANVRVDYEQQLAELTAERRMVSREIEQETEEVAKECNTLAVQHYPWISNKAAPEFQLAVAELRELGALAHKLKASPRFSLIMGRYIAGLQAERAAAVKAVKPAVGQVAAPGARPKNSAVPPAVVAGSTNRAKVSAATSQLKQAEEEARTTGSKEAFAKLRSLRRQANAAA